MNPDKVEEGELAEGPVFKDHTVRVKNEREIGSFATITINGQVIPVLSATIHMRPDEFNQVTIEVMAKDIDIVALEEYTRLEVVQVAPRGEVMSIQNRKVQPAQKYQVWWLPTKWPQGTERCWQLAGAFEYPHQAFLKRLEVNKSDPQAEILTTRTVDFDVVSKTDI